MKDLALNLAIMLDEQSDHGAYSVSAGLVFKELANTYAKQKEVKDRQILVVSSAADFDKVALPLRDELQALGARVKLACVSYSWFTWRSGKHSADWRATYRETFENDDVDIIVAISVTNEPTELITITEAAVTDNARWEPRPLQHGSIGFIVAATVPGVREAVEAALKERHKPENRVWVVGAVEPEIPASEPVSPSMKRAGVKDHYKSANIYPEYLLSRRSSGLPGRWEGSRPTPPGFISGEEDMLHDFDEIDRRNAGVLTEVKRDTIIRAAKVLGYTATDEKGVASLASSYALSIEDVKRALTEPRT